MPDLGLQDLMLALLGLSYFGPIILLFLPFGVECLLCAWPTNALLKYIMCFRFLQGVIAEFALHVREDSGRVFLSNLEMWRLWGLEELG